jgi:hypothetical protein
MIAMPRKPTRNYKAERAPYQEEDVETREEEEEEEEEEESDEEASDEEADAEGEGESDSEDEEPDDDDDDEERKPKKKAKKEKKPKKEKKEKKPTRRRSSKTVRMKVVWIVYSNDTKEVQRFEYPQEEEAKAFVASKNADDKKGMFYLRKEKVKMEDE